MDSDKLVVATKPIEDVWIAPEYESSESIESLLEYIEPEPEEYPKMKLFNAGLYSPGSGEICAKYIAMSASSVLKHPYYDYPSIKDPGLERALLFAEEHETYPNDGQELYLDLCKEMNLIPVRIFHKGLVTEEIDLRVSIRLYVDLNIICGRNKYGFTELKKLNQQYNSLKFMVLLNYFQYYGVNPVGMRAMCMALERNMTVKRWDLTSNYLDHIDACYHLGQMLGDRNALRELVLSGCNIGPKFLRHALYFLKFRTLDLLDLSENNIRDEGCPFLTDQIMQGAVIRRLNLRRNHLTSESLSMLAEVIEFHDHTTHLDISWNMFNKNAGAMKLIRALRQSKVLVELNMSYTSLCVGVEIGALLHIETLKVLDLSHNRLTTRAATIIAKNLISAKSLQILDLSCNPFTPPEALLILVSLKQEEIKLRELLMDYIGVNKEFAQELKEIRNLEFRRETVITYGNVHGNYTPSQADIKVIYLKQLVTLTKKKMRTDGFDIIVWLLDLKKTQEHLEVPMFMRTMKRAGAMVDDEFVAGLTRCFPGPKTEPKCLSLELLGDYIRRIYPEKEPTPTPEVTPPPKEQKEEKEGKANPKK